MAEQVGPRHRRWRRWSKWRFVPLLLLLASFVPPQISRFAARAPEPVAQSSLPEAENGWVALRPLVDQVQGDPPAKLFVPRPEPATITAPMTELAGFRQVVRLVCAASVVDAADGRVAQETRRLDHALRAADSLQLCDASLIQLLVSIAIEAILTRNVQNLAMAAPVDGGEAAWQPLTARLLAEPDRGQALAGALEAEYALVTQTLHDPRGALGWMTRLPNWFFDPWLTRARYHSALDRAAAEAAKPRAARDWSWLEAWRERPTPCAYNQIGTILISTMLPSFGKTADRLDQLTARRRLALTTIALRRARDRDGRLPPTLDALVDAGLLNAVPIDPFSAQPLRYDAGRQLLWSVGPDGTDNQGSMAEAEDGFKRDEGVELRFR